MDKKTHCIEVASSTMSTLHHNVMHLLNRAKLNHCKEQNQSCIVLLQEFKDILDEMTDEMEEIK